MPEIWDAVIVGGGVAGCSAAIHLADRGLSVLALEQSSYPAKKLCGEFLSTEASGYLDRLGVLGDLKRAGATDIESFRIVSTSGARVAGTLPVPAIGISRTVLDATLARRARQVGATVLEGARVDKISGDLREGFELSSSHGDYRARTVFGAFGKRSRMYECLGMLHGKEGHVAFKGHFAGWFQRATIEVFSFPGGYIGFAPIEQGLVNGCLLATRSTLLAANGSADTLIAKAAEQNLALGERLAAVERVGPMVGCSQISLRRHPTFAQDICMIGDTAGMIAPLCGDGMSMAMRSAEIASVCAEEFLRGGSDPGRFRQSYARAWSREFTWRMTVGSMLQAVALCAPLADTAVRAAVAAPGVAHALIRATRGTSDVATKPA
jgi:flavin-dependent dehydrogenase